MKLSGVGELQLVKAIRASFGGKTRAVLVGIGDDAAVIRGDSRSLLLTTDVMMEGVHFDLRLTTPYQLGFKLISVNASDICAMGGEPRYALIGLAAPKNADTAFTDEFFKGAKESLKLHGASLVGGDLSSSIGGMALSGTFAGYAKKPVLRSGARPGDRIYVTGNLGDSACGLEILKRIKKRIDFKKPLGRPLAWDVMEPLLLRHLMPTARKPLSGAAAMIDISDGLFIDLYRLCEESGVGAMLYKEKIPVSEEMRTAAARLGLDTFGLAASGGEDYELLFTSKRKVKGAIEIGEIIESGMYLIEENGKRSPISPKGYRHFAEHSSLALNKRARNI